MNTTDLAHVSVVDTATAAQLVNTDKPFVLILRKGENLFEGIQKCAVATKLKSASISGLGGVGDVNVAYYHLDRKEYETKLFKGLFELISLNGNISMVDNQPFLHIHAALGKADHSVFGGHIMDATVSILAEITIIPLSYKMGREMDESIGLKSLCPIK